MDLTPSPTIRLPSAFFPRTTDPGSLVLKHERSHSDINNNVPYPKIFASKYALIDTGPTAICIFPNRNIATPPNKVTDSTPIIGTPPYIRMPDEEDNDSGIYDLDEFSRSPVTKESGSFENRRKELLSNASIRPPFTQNSPVCGNKQNDDNGTKGLVIFDYDASPKPSRSRKIGVRNSWSELYKTRLHDVTMDPTKVADKRRSLNIQKSTDNGNTSSEHCKNMQVATSPDRFPCQHVVCHRCMRDRGHNVTNPTELINCPVCGESEKIDSKTNNGKAKNITTNDKVDDKDHNKNVATAFDRSLVRRYGSCGAVHNLRDMAHKFENVDLNLRQLKKEAMETTGVCLAYTKLVCDLCKENHGILKVLQEQDQLSVKHKRPENSGRGYRLAMGEVVTKYSSKIISSSVCVPCTYKSLRKESDLTVSTAGVSDRKCLSEVSKVVLRRAASVNGLEGKHLTDMEQNISMRVRADNFSFRRASRYLEEAVIQQEKQLIESLTEYFKTLPAATSQIEDTGKIYHVRHRNAVDFKETGGDKILPVNRNSTETEIW